jgi:hypothetical protein
VSAWLGEKFGVFGISVVGTADADAPPTSDKVNPAAPNTGAALVKTAFVKTAFVTSFFFEACFTRGIVTSPYMVNNVSSPANRLYSSHMGRARLVARGEPSAR